MPDIHHPKIGVCGLSCRLCPNYFIKGVGRCEGYKSPARMAVGCPFITCAVKKKGIEFCWFCNEQESCVKWRDHRTFSHHYDSFVCYQKLEDNVLFIQQNGINSFESEQEKKEQLLHEILSEFNEGRSKAYFCCAATVLERGELEQSLERAREEAGELDIKSKSKIFHAILDELADGKGIRIRLRKQVYVCR